MPTLWVIVPTFDQASPAYDLGVLEVVVADLGAAAIGAYTGAGGTEGHLMFGYRAVDEAAARAALERAMAKHRPRGGYHVRVTGDAGCNVAFEVLKEFRPTEFTLRRGDGNPLGDFEQVQSDIRRRFPGARFAWTMSGPERVRAQRAKGRPLPPELLQVLEARPAELEGVADGDGYWVKFGLGHQEPVELLRVTPLGSGAELREGLAGLRADAGSEFRAAETGAAAEPGAAPDRRGTV